MRPEHDDVWKLAVFGALNRHGEIATLLSESETRAVAHRVADELPDLRCGKFGLSQHPPQAIHTADGMRDSSVLGQRRQKRANIGARTVLGKSYTGQQGVGFFRVLTIPCMRIRPEGRTVLARPLLRLKCRECGADNCVARIRGENNKRTLASRDLVGN
jgi:hypothetical protein